MNPWLAAGVIIASAVVMVAVMLLIRRSAPGGGRFSDSDRASGVFGFLGAGFVILLGFVIFLGFGTYEAGANHADAEAAAVVAQFRTAADFDENLVQDAQGELVCYARSVIAQEWPSMARGERSPVTEGWVVALDDSGVQEQNATSPGDQPVINWWEATNDRQLARAGRVLVSEGQIPTLLWALLVIGAFLVVGWILLYADPREGWLPQAAMMGGVTVLVVASLLAVQVVASPFSGQSGSVDTGSMEYSLVQMDQFAKAEGTNPTVLCDKAGIPLEK
jgi:hypothetical protein